jgi:hypothetical protein
MKKLLYINTILVLLCILSCDKITNPVINKGGSVTIPITPPTHVDSTTFTDDALLKVLVEDYTAHRCPNCPAASLQCENLIKSLSPSQQAQCIFIECNVSTLAKSSGPPSVHYWNDYMNLADSNWNNTFINGDINGMPGTMVDRLYYSGNAGGQNDLYSYKDVSVPFDSLVGINPSATMNQTVNIHIVDSMYAPPTSTLSMDITTKLLHPNTANKYYLVVTLVEDSIFDEQDSISNYVPYYLKRMTMRTAVNTNGSGVGDTISAFTTAPQTLHYAYSNVTRFAYKSLPIVQPVLPWLWNMAHMYIVAFVYQTGSVNNQMVLQVQRLHL